MSTGKKSGATLGADLAPGGDSSYATTNQRSFRHYLTAEVLPKADYYSGGERPNLDDLLSHTVKIQEPGMADPPDDVEKSKKRGKVIKFGWKEGVLMRCMLNIWGVMLFLRVSWMVGNCGLWEALAIVVSANCVTTITAISMSAVATNGLIQGGGVYYMISRSLGPEFGGSIGLMFTIANSIAVATYIIGFVESLQDMLNDYFDGTIMIDGGVNDIRAVGTATLVALMILAIIGMDWVTRVQLVLLFLLIAAQIDMLIGFFWGPIDDESIARGFIGFNSEVFSTNMKNDYRYDDGDQQNIISVFAVFFTAVTGIVAGANLSGDLKDPADAIPKGTLLAIAITFVSYITYPFLLASTVVRDASGDLDMYYWCLNSTEYKDDMLNCPIYTEEGCSTLGDYADTPLYNSYNVTTCEFGLENSSQVMELVSIWGPLIYAGCFAATLSSAIASLVGAPRVLQALAKDKLYPFIYFFSKGFGANNDPVRGYCLVMLISFGCVMIGNLNAVSTLLSNFFLASYCLINVSCFHASHVKSPGWRPAYKYYNKWVSLVGALLCLVVMFLIDYITALVTFVVTIFLYLFVAYRKPDVNWGSSTQGQSYVSALKSTLSLQSVKENIKNYRPQILVLSGQPLSRPCLLDVGTLFTKNVGLLVCGHVVPSVDWRKRIQLVTSCNNWLGQNKIKAFYDIVEGADLEKGAISMFQLVGLGKLKPNSVLIGFKNDWTTSNSDNLKAYFNTIHAAFNMKLGVIILRMQDGLDCSDLLAGAQDLPTLDPSSEGPQQTPDVDDDATPPPFTLEPPPKEMRKMRGESVAEVFTGQPLTPDQEAKIKTFSTKQEKGTIDVWWLYDDGGLTLLLPYILTTRSIYKNCSLRIFALANRKDELDMEQRSMANLLSKFRIDYSDVIIIPDAMKKPTDESKQEFDQLISKFKSNTQTDDGFHLSDAELQAQQEKTNRHIRLREILLENSSKSNLIVMTLPMPRRGRVSAPLYMAWLDFMSKGMPPFLFIRGNQQSVLTFYS